MTGNIYEATIYLFDIEIKKEAKSEYMYVDENDEPYNELMLK